MIRVHGRKVGKRTALEGSTVKHSKGVMDVSQLNSDGKVCIKEVKDGPCEMLTSCFLLPRSSVTLRKRAGVLSPPTLLKTCDR